jgi:hypothetical protein
MNGERREEKALHQGWWYVDLFGLLPPSLHVCILFMGQSFALLTQLDGVPCGANLTIVIKRGVCNTASVNLLKATLRLLKRTSSRKDCRRRKKTASHCSTQQPIRGRAWRTPSREAAPGSSSAAGNWLNRAKSAPQRFRYVFGSIQVESLENANAIWLSQLLFLDRHTVALRSST